MAGRPTGIRQPTFVKAAPTHGHFSTPVIGAAGSTGLAMSPTVTASITPASKGPAPATSMSRLPSSNSIRRKIATPAGINPPGSKDSGVAADMDHFVIGDVVYVTGDANKRGKIVFMGEVAFAKGDFAGVVLDLPTGNHDGMVQGKRYFQCAPAHGLFTKLARLSRDPVLEPPTTPKAPQSQSLASSVVMSPELPRGRTFSMSSSKSDNTPTSPSSQRRASQAKSSSPGISSSLVLGERVICASATGGTKIGILRYLGPTDFAEGNWAGVELLTPMGKNNGTVGGKSYFTCKEKHGLFVAANKVISSPVNKTPRRGLGGSRESLVSMSSLASSAASKSIRRPSMRKSQCLATCQLQAVLTEKEKHVEHLIKEREMDRVDFGNLMRQHEDRGLEIKKLQAQLAEFKQQLSTANENDERVERLEHTIEEERRKLEDLQYTLDEEKIAKAEINALLDSMKAQSADETKSTEAQSQAVEELKQKLEKQVEETKEVSSKLVAAKIDCARLKKVTEEMEEAAKLSKGSLAEAQAETYKLLASQKGEIAALKQSALEKDAAASKLSQQLADTKKRENEQKDKFRQLEVEYETTLKTKTALEAEVIDLVNSKTGASELLTEKINGQSQEIQELREKLQSTEEDKAVLRRINAEFKSNKAKHEASEAALNKQLAEMAAQLADKTRVEGDVGSRVASLEAEKQKVESEKAKLEGEKAALEVEKGTLEAEKQALETEKLALGSEVKNRDGEIASLNAKISDIQKGMENSSASSKEQLDTIEKLRSENALLSKNVEGMQQRLDQLQQDKENVEAEKSKLEGEKAALEAEKGALETEKVALGSEVTNRDEEISALYAKMSDVLKSVEDSSASSKEQLDTIERLRSENAVISKNVEEIQQRLDQVQQEKEKVVKEAEEKQKELTGDNSKLAEEVQRLSSQLASTTNEVSLLKKGIETLKTEISQSKTSFQEQSARITAFEGEAAELQTTIQSLRSTTHELEDKMDALKKDKAALKSQLAKYKAESKQFEEVESALSQEVFSLQEQLAQKAREVKGAEKELDEKKKEMEAGQTVELEVEDPFAHIKFLNGVIVEQVKKMEELQIQVNILMGGGRLDAGATSNRVEGGAASTPSRQYQNLRSYCDICEKFDLHDTEDCPAQVSEDNSHHGALRGEARDYCEICEIFGHKAGECADQETF